MKPLFEMPALFDLDGILFNGDIGDPGTGGDCRQGCESGCRTGCNVGEGVNPT